MCVWSCVLCPNVIAALLGSTRGRTVCSEMWGSLLACASRVQVGGSCELCEHGPAALDGYSASSSMSANAVGAHGIHCIAFLRIRTCSTSVPEQSCRQVLRTYAAAPHAGHCTEWENVAAHFNPPSPLQCTSLVHVHSSGSHEPELCAYVPVVMARGRA